MSKVKYKYIEGIFFVFFFKRKDNFLNKCLYFLNGENLWIDSKK